jgi:hypothetical protein
VVYFGDCKGQVHGGGLFTNFLSLKFVHWSRRNDILYSGEVIMFCHECGAADQNQDAYCRRCGQWLSNQKPGRSRASSKPQDLMKGMLVFNCLSAIFGLVSAVSLYATYLGSKDAKWSIYVAAAFCSVIAVHQTISFFFALGLRQRFKEGREVAVPSEPKRADPALLEGGPDTGQLIDSPSVTETTTELLEVQRPRPNRTTN